MFSLLWSTFIVAVIIPVLLYIYIRRNDAILTQLLPAAQSFSPQRCTREDIHTRAKNLKLEPISILEQIPPKTGRHYIVVGGAGFLGGWIVVHLLRRGEDPRRIRVLDINLPTRIDLTTGLAREVAFVKVDICDAKALELAFQAPWPSRKPGEAALQVTVFHTAANIRFYERHASLLPESTRVNVDGTTNIINAARSIGASILIYTSSGSIAVRNSRFFLWPWETVQKYCVQVISDDTPIREDHDKFFSNYAYTKFCAEKLVREADKSSSGDGTLRTGVLRPGNGVFGPGGDLSVGAYLMQKNVPSWQHNIVQSWIYVENCSIGHLLYEQRLLEMQHGKSKTDIGGRAFTITDPGPPSTTRDVYLTLEVLRNGEINFPSVSPTAMLLLSHFIEAYCLTRHFLVHKVPLIGSRLPPMRGVLGRLQPAIFRLTMVHVIVDDSRARLAPEKGGLGYKGACTTLEGAHLTVADFEKNAGRTEERSKYAGVSLISVFDVKKVGADAKIAGQLELDGYLSVKVTVAQENRSQKRYRLAPLSRLEKLL